MAGMDTRTGLVRIGVDFGESLTVIVISHPDGSCHTMEFPGISRQYPVNVEDHPVHVIPSQLRYKEDGSYLMGDEVHQSKSAHPAATACWIRRYLCQGNSVQIPAGNGRMKRYEVVATDFLSGIISSVTRKNPHAGLVFTVPYDAPPNYREILERSARAAGAVSCSIIPEYLAAAEGYGFVPVDREPFVVITFSDTEPEIEIVSFDRDAGAEVSGGIRVISGAGTSDGCRAIDTWIATDLLTKFRLTARDPRAVRIVPLLHSHSTRLRESLPFDGEQTVLVTDTVSGRCFSTIYTLHDLDRVLEEHDVAGSLMEGILRALAGVTVKGGDVSKIRNVLLLGSGCTLPIVRETVQSRFPDGNVFSGYVLDAVTRGAAIHTEGVRAPDQLTCSYAVRYWNSAVREHHYRFLVHRGTRYPSCGQVARSAISAAYDGQTHLGIPLYEIDSKDEFSPGIELVSDTHGGVRLAGPVQDADIKKPAVHVNVHSPTLLIATPPGKKGEPRFECTFTIDPERNLCLSPRDLLTGALIKLNAPIHRLR